MDCPQCHRKMMIQERICRRCRFLPEQGRVVEIEPPRAARARRLTVMPRRRLARLMRSASERRGIRLPFRVLAGAIPGAGQILGGQLLRGLLYFFFTAAAVLGGNRLGGAGGQILIGLAAAAHAHSLLELFPDMEWDNVLSRMVAMGALLLTLMALIYWPLSRQLSLLNNDVIPINQRYVTRYYASQMVEIVLICSVLFVVAYAASVFLGLGATSLSRRRKPR